MHTEWFIQRYKLGFRLIFVFCVIFFVLGILEIINKINLFSKKIVTKTINFNTNSI